MFESLLLYAGLGLGLGKLAQSTLKNSLIEVVGEGDGACRRKVAAAVEGRSGAAGQLLGTAE